MSGELKISIIIPVYNVENYIERCIQSVINQTYGNIQIIIVNDKSPDGSDSIIRKYVNDDKRIEYIIREQNGGLSAARNTGLELVKGDFVLYLDGDDYLDRDCIQLLLEDYSEEIDVILFPYIREYENKSIKSYLFDETGKEDLSVKGIFSELIGPTQRDRMSPKTMNRLNTAWGKLYKYSCIKNVRFVDTKIIGIEDGWYNICVFSKMQGKVRYVKSTFYHYEKNNSYSLLHVSKSNFVEKRWNFYREVRNLLDQENKFQLYEENLNNRIIIELFDILINICRTKQPIIQKISDFNECLKNYPYRDCFEKFDYKKLNGFWRIFYKLCSRKRIKFLVLIVSLWIRFR